MAVGILTALVVVLALALLTGIGRGAWKTEHVYPWEVGLLYGSRGFVRELSAGTHRLFDPLARQTLYRVTAISRSLAPQTIEAISKDQFAFRLVLTPLVTITDARAFVEQTPDTPQAMTGAGASALSDQRYDRLGPTLASAALAAIAARTLEEVMADPAAVVAEVRPHLAGVLPGSRLDDLLLTGVTLPPEVRKMFTEVERARREGLASLERARSEQAALRALANAARNLADNPALSRLRTLQMMENAKGAKTFVFGGTAEEGLTGGTAAD